MSPKILYLGLEPPPGTLHYPVIRTEKITGAPLDEALRLWPQFSHVVFTSKTAVRYWFESSSTFDKIAIAIGDATALVLKERDVHPLVAPEATQEGVIQLLETLETPYLFLPHSKRARPLLKNDLSQRQIRFFSLDLYDTLFQKPEPVPDLQRIEEIVFTSPSTVEGFLKIFGHLPKNKILTPIGPVTARYLEKYC